MKLEDITKEELIYILQNTYFWSEERIMCEVLFYRNRLEWRNFNVANEISIRALKDNIKILKPYEGKKHADIPDDILKSSVKLWDKYKKYADIAQKNYENY